MKGGHVHRCMVGDMLMSPHDRVPLMEEHGGDYSQQNQDLGPVPSSHTANLVSCDSGPEKSSISPCGDTVEQQNMSSSQENGGQSLEETKQQQPHIRSCKHKLELYQPSEAHDFELNHPESPPPAKQWVIGPLFQSFRSKMASFTEIVMSPVRLLTESPPAAEGKKYEEQNNIIKHQEAGVVQSRDTFRQTLRFDIELESDAGSEQQRDSSSAFSKEPSTSKGTSDCDLPHEGFSSNSPKSDLHLRNGDIKELDHWTDVRSAKAFESSRNSCESQKVVYRTQNRTKGSKRRGGNVIKKSQKVSLDRRMTTSTQRKVHSSNPCGSLEMPSGSGLGNEMSEFSRTNLMFEGCFNNSTLTQDPELSRPSSGVLRVTRQCRKPQLKGSTVPESQNEAKLSEAKAPKKPPVSTNGVNMSGVQMGGHSFQEQGMSMSLTLQVKPVVGADDRSTNCRMMMLKDGTVGEESVLDINPERVLIKNEAKFESHAFFSRTISKSDKQRRTLTLEDGNIQESPSAPNRLKRSHSCPDISSLRHSDHALVLYQPSPKRPAYHSSPLKRERRHTVCSLEVEREIAPLCLRKEVYPNWMGMSKSTPPWSPSRSLATLVSCFLSSPLAFLSQKPEPGWGANNGHKGLDLSLTTSSTSATPGLFPDSAHTAENTSISSLSSVFSSVPESAEDCGIAQECDAVVMETMDNVLADSNIKNECKQLEKRKVSSIRIRKTLPKPQYNLTPMGLPKAVRVKKKIFSVEEIYTNKNFTQPPEGRLETIFEVPLSRRDGSESLIGPKRIKRVIDFPELGVARKPKRSLISGSGGTQRKGAGNAGSGRTRRGVWASSKEDTILVQDLDSLLCSKLSELDMWMNREQTVC